MAPPPQGTGKLIVKGSKNSAGIGGNDGSASHNITIESCYVEAYGGENAAGIGGGNWHNGNNITINGGTVTAYGGQNASGIGGGHQSLGGTFNNITINGGTVYAYGGSNGGAGIGAGRSGETNGIFINENIEGVKTYVEAHGKDGGAGIGNGSDYGSQNQSAHNIKITGGTVKAYGGNEGGSSGGAGIGGGSQLKGYDIEISGGDVYAQSKNQAAAIGGGYHDDGFDITISGGTVVANADGGKDYADGAGIGGGASGKGYRISITGGTVTATSGHGAGIGGGNGGKLENENYGVNISGGNITAGSNGNGAGIGGGSGGACDGSIEISGSETYLYAYSARGGAGIGGGYKKDSHNITINEGTVIAKSRTSDAGTETSGAGIGSGSEGKAKDTIQINGGNVTATAGGSADSCEKGNKTGSAIGCGATNSDVSDGKKNKRVENVYVSQSLSAQFTYGGSEYSQTITPNSENWATHNTHNENFSKWRDVKISNGVERSITIDASATAMPTYGTSATSTYGLTANYVSGTNWSIQWYDANGTALTAGPATLSVSSDMKHAYLDYAGTGDAGDYQFTLTCDSVTSAKADYKVNTSAATIASGSAKKVYDGTPLTCETYETSGFVEGQGVNVTCTGSCTGSATQTAPTVADNTFTYTAKDGTNLDNYNIDEVEGTLTVVKELFVVTAGNYSGTYDGQEHKFNDESNGTKVKVTAKNGIDYTSVATLQYQTSSSKEGPWTEEGWGGAVPSIKDAGTLYVKVRATATIGGTEKTLVSSDVYTMEVTKRNVTLTSADDAKEYDGTALECKAMSVGGDGFAGTEGAAYVYTGSQTKAGSSANSFNYTLNGGASEDNYNITKVEGTLTVTPKSDPITITTSSKTWTYDGKGHSACTKDDWGYYGELVKGESLDVNFEYTDANQVEDAGTYANSLTDNEDLNKKAYRVTDNNGDDVTNCYTFNAVEEGTLTIEKRAVTLTSGNDLKVWAKEGDKAYSKTVTADPGTAAEGGLLDTDTLTYSDFPEVTKVSYTPTDNTFTYKAADGSTFDADNYNITQVYGKLMLVEEMSIIGEDQVFTYDGTAHKAPVTLIDNGQGAAVKTTYATSKDNKTWTEYTTTEPSLTDAGTLYVKAKAVKGVQEKDASYTLTVAKRNVVISTDSATKSYDGNALTEGGYTISGDGFVSGQSATITVKGSQTDVGSSQNTFECKFDLVTNPDNYAISEQLGTLTVTANADPIAISTHSESKVYDGTPLSCADCTIKWGSTEKKSGDKLCGDDVLTVTTTGTITNVGSADNTVSYQVVRDGKDVTSYYTFDKPDLGTLTVDKRNVTINTASAEKVYDGTALVKNNADSTKGALDYTVTGDGFIGGEGITVTITGTRTNAGTASNTCTYAFKEGTASGNYKVTTELGTLTVNKRKVTVTSGSAVSTWSSCPNAGLTNTSACTVSNGGFVSGEMASYYPKGDGVLEKPSSEPTVGSPATADNTIAYSWTGNGNPANYQITENLGKLMVTNNSADAAVVTGYQGVYDGQAHEVTFASTLTNVSKTEYSEDGANWSETPITRTDAGTTTVYVRLTGMNGAMAQAGPCSITITQRSLTLTAGSATKVYDGDALTCDTYVVGGDGFVAGEEPTVQMTAESTVTDVNKEAVANKIDEAKLKETKGDYKYSNYNIDLVDGILTVTKRPVVLISKGYGYTADELVAQGASSEFAQAVATGTEKYDGTAQKREEVIEVGHKTGGTGLQDIEGMGFVNGQGATFKDWKSFKDAGTYSNTFGYTLNNGTNKDNYNITCHYGNVKISPREVTLTSASDSKMYDGTPLTNGKVTVTGDGFISGEEPTYDVTGSQTEVGKSANTFGYTLKSGTKATNYKVSCTEGTLEVYTNTTLRVVVPETAEYTYDGTPHGEAAKAYIGDELQTGVTVWYSVDGGKTFTDTPTKRVGSGTSEVTVHVSKSGYETAEGSYKIIVKAAEASPASSEIIAVDANQDDIDAAVKAYADSKGLGEYHAYVTIVSDPNALGDAGDLSKLQAAAPGKSLKYSNTKLLLNVYDAEGNYVTAGGVTYKDYDIGSDNLVPVEITYRNDSANQSDFACLRVHQGVVESLSQGEDAAVAGEYWTMDQSAGTITVTATDYSTYALAYTAPDSADSTAKTGDSAGVLAGGALALAAAAAAAVVVAWTVRRRRDESC